jgi:tetratricopeptide (TPR) repeat protein
MLLHPDPVARRLFPLLVCALTVVACSRSPKSYVERGNSFAAAGKYADAAIQYENAIQKDDGYGDAHYRLGLLDLKRGQTVPAFRELRRAAELMPKNEEALFQLGQVSLSIYNADARHPATLYDQASKADEQLLRLHPDGYAGNLLKGALAIVDKNPVEAAQRLRKAAKAKPGDPDAQLGLATALAQSDQVPEALSLAQDLIRRDKTYAPAYQFLFQQYQAAGRKDDAEGVLRLQLDNNPKQSAYVVELARYYAATQRTAEMEATLAKLAVARDFPTGRLIAGDFYLSLGKPDQALGQFGAGLASASKDRNTYRKRMIPILAAQKKWPESYELIAAALKDQPNDEEIKLMRALAWLDEGKPQNLDGALAELKAQSAKKSNDASLHFQTGVAMARKGDKDGALREWVAANKADKNYLPSRYSLIQLYLSQGKNDQALSVSEEIVAATPRDARAILAHASCLTAAGQYMRARTELNRLIVQFPQSPQLLFRLGVLDIAEQKYKDAEDTFRKIEGAAAKDPQVLAGMAQALQGLGQGAQAIQMLQAEVKRDPISPALRQLLANIAAAAGKYDIAVDEYKELADAAPGSVSLQLSLASAYTAKGDAASAQGVLEKAAQADPKSVPASLMLAQSLVANGHIEEAKARYRKVLQAEPDNANALNDLAFLMADSGENLDLALSYAQRGSQFAKDPGLKTSLSDTVGWIYVKKNMNDAAVQTFETLVRNDPRNSTYLYHLGAALLQKGDKQGAKVRLQAALAAAKPGTQDEARIKELLSRP